MSGNIIYLGRYSLAKEYRCAGAKRVYNQGIYLRKKFNFLIITFSADRSEESFNRNFLSPGEKQIFIHTKSSNLLDTDLLHFIQTKTKGTNCLLLETCADFYSAMPLLFAKLSGYKVVHDVLEDFYSIQEDLSFKQRFHLHLKKIMHAGLRLYADGIIVISDRLFAKYARLNIPMIKLYNSVEPREQNEIPNPRNGFTFFYSGTFCTKDGVIDLVQGFNVVQKNNPDIKLVLVGKGDFNYFQKCLSMIRENQNISYLGFISEKQMFTELSKTDLCCITRIDSDYANSGFPFKLAEYLSFGKPILSTAVSDIPSLFIDKKNILLAEPGNPASVAAAMEFALKNQDSIAHIGENGKALCDQIFSIDHIGEALENFLLHLN